MALLLWTNLAAGLGLLAVFFRRQATEAVNRAKLQPADNHWRSGRNTRLHYNNYLRAANSFLKSAVAIGSQESMPEDLCHRGQLKSPAVFTADKHIGI